MVQIMTTLIPQSTQRHVCRVCDKTFRASSLLDIHMRVHVGAKPYACPSCGHRATQKGNLKLHMKKHHGMDLPPYIDMVPDSGIWRDTEELSITEVYSPCSESDHDDPKRKKVITQAMSSLLDPCVVELIKRCQNSVGQGMTGRITESLKDFIKVAQGSTLLKESMKYSSQNESMNSVSVITSPREYVSQNNFPVTPTTKRVSVDSDRSVREQQMSPKITTEMTEVEILQFYNERLRNLKFRVDASDKDKYLAYLKLYRYNAMMEHKMRHKSLRQVKSNIENKTYSSTEWKCLGELNKNDTQKSKSDSKLDCIPRVSPGVLSMLRKTVLNSVEQKEAKTKCAEGEAHENNVVTETAEKTSDHLQDDNFSNSAMKSLAAIGKTFLNTSGQPNKDMALTFGDESMPEDCSDLTLLNQCPAFKCQFCHKEYKYKSVLEIHMRSHTGERPYKCSYCEYAGTQHNCLKLHIQRHHPNEYYTHHVDMPGKGPGLSMIPTSLMSQNNDSRVTCLSPVNCPVCGRVSPSPGYLKIHMRSHKKSLDHVCHICGRGFKEYWYLSTHLKTHEREMTSMKLSSQSAASQFHNLLRNSVLSHKSNYNNNLSPMNFLFAPNGEPSPTSPLAQYTDRSIIQQDGAIDQPFVPIHVIRRTVSPSQELPSNIRSNNDVPQRIRKRKSSIPTKILPRTEEDEEPHRIILPPKKARLNNRYLTHTLNKITPKESFQNVGEPNEDQPLDLSIRKSTMTFNCSSPPTSFSNRPKGETSKPLNLCTNVH